MLNCKHYILYTEMWKNCEKCEEKKIAGMNLKWVRIENEQILLLLRDQALQKLKEKEVVNTVH